MNPNFSPRLGAHLSAFEAGAPASAVESAQRKLEARLASSSQSGRPWLGWIAAAATACVVLAMVMLPTSRGIAFDVVQKHLRDFRTLTLVIEQTSQGVALPDIRVRMNREGDVRTDVGDLTSTIVNPRQHAMLTLLHNVHQALQLPLSAATSRRDAEQFAWLDAIRNFQGQATRLPGARVIDGRPTTGWALDTGGMHIELWADADGMPLAVKIDGGRLLSQRMHVTVDAPIDATVFSTRLPAGYHRMGSDNP